MAEAHQLHHVAVDLKLRRNLNVSVIGDLDLGGRQDVVDVDGCLLSLSLRNIDHLLLIGLDDPVRSLDAILELVSVLVVLLRQLGVVEEVDSLNV